jgi:hypothetical protein
VCDDGVACNGAEVCDDISSRCMGVASICSADQVCDVGTNTCKLTCAGCIIDGSCYAKGRSSSANSCLVCDPDKTSAAWSIAAGAGCDDGDLCTNNDRCDNAGRCEGTAVVCTDDAAVCGADRTCNPSTGLCAEQFPGSSVTCDDGDSCTANDRCNGTGRCVGAPSTGTGCECLNDPDCNDGLTCTTDTCSQGKCSSVVSTGCLIGGTKCYANAAPNPTNSCQRCDVSLSNKAWSNSPSTTSCDDGLWCNGDQDFCDGQGSCSHAYPSSNRCAGTTGTCEIKTCNESKKNCYAPAGIVCDQQTKTGCANGNACSSDVFTWPVQYTCSGNSANCGTSGTERTDLKTLKTNCGAAESCNSSSATCKPTLGCDITYCRSGLCWTKQNAPVGGTAATYIQNDGRVYCSGLSYAGRTDWRLPSVAEMGTLVEGPTNGCYWPVEMGSCTDELWTTNEAQSFAFWVGTAGMWPNTAELFVRCVVNQ